MLKKKKKEMLYTIKKIKKTKTLPGGGNLF